MSLEVPKELREEARKHDMYLTPIAKDTYELFFGPQHMATENFSIILKMDGNRVEKAIVNPGFLHRGFEKTLLHQHRLTAQNLRPRERRAREHLLYGR